VPAGGTADSLILAQIDDGVRTACLPPLDHWTAITIDGHPARLAQGGCNEHFYYAEAVVAIGRRVWFFELIGPDRSLIVPFLTTVKLDPASATD
jgi:hypothetical protein